MISDQAHKKQFNSHAFDLTSPDDLTNTLINQIGKTGLKARQNTQKNAIGLFDQTPGSNERVAFQLMMYNEPNSAYFKWLFLADQYPSLSQSNSELATLVYQLFKKVYPDLSTDSSMSYQTINNATLSTAERARKALQTAVNLHYIHPYLNKIEAEKLEGTLSGSTHLHSLQKQPEALSNAIIQNIGEAYLRKHPLNQGCFSFLNNLIHGHQMIAKSLKHYNKATSPYEKWLFLSELYAKLNKSQGELSDAILKLFQDAFNECAYTHPTGGNYFSCIEPKKVAQALRGIIVNHYADRYCASTMSQTALEHNSSTMR